MEKKVGASQIALWVLLILSAIVLVLFYGVGYGNQEFIGNNTYTAPANTGLLIVWLYALVIICAGVVFVFGLMKAFTKKSKKGVRTGLVGPVFIFMFAAVIVSYFLSSSKAVRLGDNSLFTKVADLKLADTCLYSMYALLLVAIVAALLAMVGAFKAKVNNQK